jgi:hypothetical protein
MIFQGLLHSGQFHVMHLQLTINFMQVLFSFLTFNSQVGESFQILDQVLTFWVACSKNINMLKKICINIRNLGRLNCKKI